MNTSSIDILKELNEKYFWDVDISKLDPEKSKRLIIERVFSLGDIDEMNTVLSYYGEKQVVDVLCRLSYLDPKTLNFVSRLFNKPREDFRCHKNVQSAPQYWNS